MATFADYLDTKPYFILLKDIITDGLKSDVSEETLEKLAEGLKETNLVLPIICLSDKVEQYPLLAGLPLIEAAKIAGLEQMWVMLIAKPKADALKMLHSLPDLLKVNGVFASDEQTKKYFFVAVLDKGEQKDLTTIKGIGKVTAEKIIKSRPYKTWEDVEKMGGKKTPLKWLQNYWANH
jgi:DNA uptake protein ComE-like DNA-binding protein